MTGLYRRKKLKIVIHNINWNRLKNKQNIFIQEICNRINKRNFIYNFVQIRHFCNGMFLYQYYQPFFNYQI